MLLYSSSNPEPNPLAHLQLVDHFLANPDFPRTALVRDIAAKHILTDCITSELQTQRRYLNRDMRPTPETLNEAEESIREDGRSQNPELIGWSVLFYRYVRIELNITTELYSQFAYMEQRTLRRYQLHSAKRLTEKLIQQEWEIRYSYRQMRLQAALPSIVPVKLFGRDSALNLVENLFQNKLPQHFQITGGAGVGKSAFAQEFVRSHIDRGVVDEIIWLKQPQSLPHIYYHLIEKLAGEQKNFDLRQYTLLNRLYLILDDADSLNPEGLKQFLLDAGAACVMMTARQPLLLDSAVQHISLSELADHEAIEMIQALAEPQHDITEDYAGYIWQTLGGNPLVIKLTLNNLSLKHPDFLDLTALDQVFDETFEALPESLRRAWMICALYPAGDIDVSQLLQVWSGFIELPAIDALLKRKLIDRGLETASCRMVLSAQHYLENSSKHRHEVQTGLSEVLDYLSETQLSAPSAAYGLMEHILLAEWPVLDASRRKLWIKSLVSTGLKHGRFLTWLQILEGYADTLSDIELCFHYARALRQLSLWEKAQALLEGVVAHHGEQGNFVEQGRALLELGILLRQKGAYTDSVKVLAKVERVADQFQKQELKHTVQLELAQILIDQGQLSLFNALASQLPVTPRLLSMQISACLISKEFDKGLEIAKRILNSPDTNPTNAGRMYGTIGRIYEQKQDYEQATHYLGQSIAILERERDRYALARVQSNLGAVLTYLGLYDEAYTLLETAIETQQILGDRTGLAATQHNLAVLRQMSIH